MLPATYDIAIYKGDTFALDFRLRGRSETGAPKGFIDLTGCTATAELKGSPTGSVIKAFTCTIADQGTDEGLGRVLVRMSPTDTGSLSTVGGVWDVQVAYPSGFVRTYLRGSVSVTEDVTG